MATPITITYEVESEGQAMALFFDLQDKAQEITVQRLKWQDAGCLHLAFQCACRAKSLVNLAWEVYEAAGTT